jgi:putative transposase
VASGEQPGFPRLHGKDRYHSVTYKEYGNGARLENGSLVLSQIGRIAVRWSRPSEGTIKTVTIANEADGWYVSFSCAEVPTEPLPLTGKETGIDVGLTVVLLTAAGESVPNPRHYRTAERALKQAQLRVSRRTQGSRRRRTAVQVLAKQQQHVRRQRSDFQHKTALALVRAYDTISVEAIAPANVSRRPAPKQDEHGTYQHNGAAQKAGLNTSIQDAGWRSFRSILACTPAGAGKRVAAVPPAYTSQDCSGCGERIHKSLSVRTHVCTNCGLILDRDLNAASNMLWLGQRLRGVPAVAGAMNREPVGL